MKWESAPLWPVVLPSITGLLLSFIPYLFELEYFSKRNLVAPILILSILGLACMLLPERYGNKVELYLGYLLALLLTYSFGKNQNAGTPKFVFGGKIGDRKPMKFRLIGNLECGINI